MPEEDIRLTRFIVKYPYKKGFLRGKREGPEWTFPEVCPCCGVQTRETLPERVELDGGSYKYWFDFQVPYCPTCLAHVKARKGEAKAANTLGVVAALVAGAAIYAGIWQARGGGDPFKKVENWEVFLICCVGAAVWGATGWLLKRHYTGRAGSTLPRTENCTTALGMELALDNVRLLGESDLLLNIDCAHPAFAEALRARNPNAFTGEEEVFGRAVRTQRGDLVVRETSPVSLADLREG